MPAQDIRSETNVPGIPVTASNPGSMVFGVQLPDGTVDDAFVIDTDGNVTARGTITGEGDPGITIGDVPLSGSGGQLFLGGDVAGASTGMTTTVAAAGNTAYAARVINDTVTPFLIRGRGEMAWGPGNAARDCTWGRGAANRMDLTTADLRIATAGRGLQVAEGANAKMGTATLAAGTVVVATTAVTANSRVFLTAQTSGAAPGALRVSARVAGTSFTITSSNAGDTSSVAWMLIEPA